MPMKYVFQHHFLIHISAQMSEESMMTHTHTHLGRTCRNLKKKQALLPLRENINRSIYPQFWLTHPKWRKWVLRPSDLYPQPTGSPERSSKGFHRDSYSIPDQVWPKLQELRFPWNSRGIPETKKLNFWGPKKVAWGREDLTRKHSSYRFDTAIWHIRICVTCYCDIKRRKQGQVSPFFFPA